MLLELRMHRVCISNDINITSVEVEILGDEISRNNTGAEVYLAWNERINDAFFDKRKSLKAVVRYGVGYDNVDVSEANKRNIKVCIVPDYGVHEVAQTAAAFIFEKTRNIYDYDRASRANYNSQVWQIPNKQIKRVSSLKVGVIGAGRIGSTLIRLCRSFGYQVSFYDPYVCKGYEKVLGCDRASSLADLLRESDFVSVHVPCNSETLGMIDKEFIKNIKHGSSLINTARGNLIKDYSILEKALDNHVISNVFLDVLKLEPPKRCSLLDKWENGCYNNRLVINPHTSFYSQQSFIEMRRRGCETAINILMGLEPYCEVKL